MSPYKKRGLLFWLLLPMLAGPLLYARYRRKRKISKIQKALSILKR